MQGALGAISYVRGLRVLRIEDLHCRLETEAVMDLGALEQVRQPPHQTCAVHTLPLDVGWMHAHHSQARQCTSRVAQMLSLSVSTIWLDF